MRKVTMRFASAAAVSCVLALGAGLSSDGVAAAPANSPQALADAGFMAMGLSDVKLAPTILNLRVAGSMQAWDPGESESVSDPLKPDWGTSTFTQTWDRSRDLYRVEWVRPRAGNGMRNYTEIVYPNGGYVTGIDVNGGQPRRATQETPPRHAMSALRLTATSRELERDSVMIRAHEHPDRVSEADPVTVGGKRYPAIQYRGDYGTYTIMYDPATHLPAIVRTRDFDVHAGDSNYDETLSDWRDIGMMIKLPFHRVHTLNGTKIFDTTITKVDLNPQLAADSFTIPVPLRGKAPPPAAIGKVPFQWVIRRMGNGFYLDSDALYTDDGANLQLMDVGPNISMATGGSHNTLIVATNTYLVAFDAPGDDGLSKWVIDAAAQKYPGKPFRYVVLTHHHIDHTGGLRAYAAEGATFVVGKGNGAFFRRALAAPHGLDPYPLKPFTPKVVEVDGKWSVNDGGRVIEAYSLDTPHAQGYIIPYVPDAKLGWVTDLWNPGGPVNMPNAAQIGLVRGIQKMGIQPDRFAGGHGAVGPYSDLAQAVQRAGG